MLVVGHCDGDKIYVYDTDDLTREKVSLDLVKEYVLKGGM